MTEVFLKIVNMSISATWLVLAVVVLRLALKKAPKWVNVLLWGLVAVRLVCPFSLESALSLIPSAETVSPEIMMDPSPTIHTGIETVNSVVNPILAETFTPEPAASANPLQILLPTLALVWCVGMALMLLYTLISYQHLRRQVKMAIRVKENIYLSEFVSSPFVLGIFRPKIYLPYHMSELDRFHVLAHERTHIRRKDHWWKPLGFLLLTVHWFNPVMWVAYILLCRDIELACDEKVIQELGTQQRADYSQALLHCSIDRRTIAACPLAFGEVGVKERVKNVLHYKKPAFWVVVIAVLICVVVAVCFLTDPVAQDAGELSVSFEEFDFRNISEIMLINTHNGNITHLSDSEQIDSVCAFLKSLSGTGGTSSKGISEGSYSLTLIPDSGDEINILFGDTDHFFYGGYGDGYPVMYDLENMAISDVTDFFRQYDTGSADISDRNVTIEAAEESPYAITSTIPDTSFFGGAEFLTPGDITGYNFFPEEEAELAAILRSLTQEDFIRAEGITPVTKFTLSWEDGEILLFTDGVQVEFGENARWAVEDEELNRFLSQYRQDDNSYETYNVAPLEELSPRYSLEEATIDKVVIMVDGDIRDNQDIWQDFLQHCSLGSECTVRVMHYYSPTETREAFRTIYDLTFDGGKYSLRWFEDGAEYTKSYQYLRHFAGPAESPTAVYDAYDHYVLTDNATATWEELFLSLASSKLGAAIPHHTIYSDMIYYPDHPAIPTELTSAALEMDGERFLTITDPATLAELSSMFSNAELMWEPKTYNLGPVLTLTDAAGKTYPIELDVADDLCRIDGQFYDYGPGYNENGGNFALPDLWKLLELSNWPQSVLDKYADYLGYAP